MINTLQPNILLLKSAVVKCWGWTPKTFSQTPSGCLVTQVLEMTGRMYGVTDNLANSDLWATPFILRVRCVCVCGRSLEQNFEK